MVGTSMLMSGISAFTFTGNGSAAYSAGPTFLIIYLANIVAFAIGGLFLAGWLRQTRAHTTADVVRMRFGTGVEQFSVVTSALLAPMGAAIQLWALGVFASSAFDLPLGGTIVVMGAIVVFYSTTGGKVGGARDGLRPGAGAVSHHRAPLRPRPARGWRLRGLFSALHRSRRRRRFQPGQIPRPVSRRPVHLEVDRRDLRHAALQPDQHQPVRPLPRGTRRPRRPPCRLAGLRAHGAGDGGLVYPAHGGALSLSGGGGRPASEKPGRIRLCIHVAATPFGRPDGRDDRRHVFGDDEQHGHRPQRRGGHDHPQSRPAGAGSVEAAPSGRPQGDAHRPLEHRGPWRPHHRHQPAAQRTGRLSSFRRVSRHRVDCGHPAGVSHARRTLGAAPPALEFSGPLRRLPRPVALRALRGTGARRAVDDPGSHLVDFWMRHRRHVRMHRSETVHHAGASRARTAVFHHHAHAGGFREGDRRGARL